MTITQSEVDEHLAMLVPVFADFGQGMVGLGQVELEGNTSFSGDVLLSRQPKKVALNAYNDILSAERSIGPRFPGNNFHVPAKTLNI